MTADDATCTRHITDAGLPRRAGMLAREADLYDEMVRRATTPPARGRGETPDAVAPTVAGLRATLAADDLNAASAAAFLLGRCAEGGATADDALRGALTGSAHAPVKIEAAMSLVLRGHREEGQAALRALAASTAPFDEGYVAAGYLTQLDDPSGWPTIVALAGQDLGHYRLMALRHAALFQPWVGETVGAERVDPGALLRDHAGDSSVLVRRELPRLIAALDLDAGRAVLTRMAADDPDERVRRAASAALAEP